MFVIAEGFSWLSPQSWWNIAQMAIGLGVVIFVHELGHFLAAKACGVKCEKFYVGFDVPMPKIGSWQIPSKLVHFQYGETEYGIGVLPLGGYVKMLGQDDNPANAEKEAERTRIKKDDVEDENATAEHKAATAEHKAATAGRASHSDDASPSSKADAAPAATPHEDHHKSIDDTNLEPQPLRENIDYELDPRSYTAKAVWQRLIIISAGVVMNIIFAVVFATIAYRIGVPYTPSVIGGTIPGSPAWQINLPEGAQVLGVGENAEPREHLRFSHDMSQQIILHGFDSDLSLLIQEKGSDHPRKITLRPEERDLGKWMPKIASIGVIPTVEPVLGDKDPLLEGFPAAQADVKLQPKDRIIAGIVDGEETKIETFQDLQRFLAQNVDNAVTLRVERKIPIDEKNSKTEIHEAKIAARPLRRLGLVMTMGPVTAIQIGSPGEKAEPVGDPNAEKGFQKGDVLTAIDGQALDDPMTAPDVIRRAAGKEVVITVLRPTSNGKKKEVELRVTPEPVNDYQVGSSETEPVLVDALGLTYAVEPVITAVDSRSDASGKLKPGDKIVKFQFVPAGDNKEEITKNKQSLVKKRFTDNEIDLSSGKFSWTHPFFAMQSLPPEGRVKVTYVRDGKEDSIVLNLYDSSETHYPMRGMRLKLMEKTHVATSWGEAFSLGMRATGENLMLVVTFLKKLVYGQISPTALGGPGTIAVAATSEASRGTASLLLFLTMLSANLAVVNFLPIPVLDGGHALFLIYEGICRRPVPEAWQIRLTLAGFAFILCLMAFVIGLDIYRLSGMAG